MTRRVPVTPGSLGQRPPRASSPAAGPQELPATAPERPAPPLRSRPVRAPVSPPEATDRPPAAKGLRSRGFLSHGGSPSGEAPRKARGKKIHADVVRQPVTDSAPPKPGDYAIRAKRLPSLREDRKDEG
ncbi:hypothetical protein [Pannonibacter tanglangensis]|uniref:Uncharacterized protein n=1 Tax=Pannonibacter tanglangensis TaxID=2750084 RepID=A0ABW9ZPI8_9HYPH|nr:hypothetical protein [Pannonibacter sp. XCT-34]NBN64889.1 hypothetical protein [Pannonibacter sp. XCT-34]